MVQIVIERVEQLARPLRQRVARSHSAFHQVRELTEPNRTGHARASFARVQRALQRLRSVLGGGPAAPGAKLLAGLREQFRGFFEKYRKHLAVDVVVDIGEGFVGGGGASGAGSRWRSRR